VVLTASLSATTTPGGPRPRQALRDAARLYWLRVLGPNCVGLLVPGIGLNAGFAHTPAWFNNHRLLEPIGYSPPSSG
jgi:acetyltransferase